MARFGRTQPFPPLIRKLIITAAAPPETDIDTKAWRPVMPDFVLGNRISTANQAITSFAWDPQETPFDASRFVLPAGPDVRRLVRNVPFFNGEPVAFSEPAPWIEASDQLPIRAKNITLVSEHVLSKSEEMFNFMPAYCIEEGVAYDMIPSGTSAYQEEPADVLRLNGDPITFNGEVIRVP